jgi:transposase
MAHRSIGQERFGFAGEARSGSSLDEIGKLLDWRPVAALLDGLYPATKGEPAWPPLAMFKALLLSIWYDLSDVKLAEALDDRAWFRRFCGFSGSEAVPERTAFVRFRRALVEHGLDTGLFDAVTAQLKARGRHRQGRHAGRCDDHRICQRGRYRRPVGQAPGQGRGAWLQGACRRRCDYSAGREGRDYTGERE